MSTRATHLCFFFKYNITECIETLINFSIITETVEKGKNRQIYLGNRKKKQLKLTLWSMKFWFFEHHDHCTREKNIIFSHYSKKMKIFSMDSDSLL